MKKIFAFTLLLMLSLTACTDDDEHIKLPIEGKWNLISYTDGDYAEIYDEGEILWEFNKYEELIVEIDENTDLSNSQLPITEPGTYNYVAAEEVISLEDVQYAIDIENGILTLDHNSAAGGIMIKFSYIDDK